MDELIDIVIRSGVQSGLWLLLLVYRVHWGAAASAAPSINNFDRIPPGDLSAISIRRPD